MLRIIEFYPPMSGIDREFNTFRLGLAWSKRVCAGETVLLMDKKQFGLIGIAEVVEVHTGKLREMSALHGSRNHNQKHLPPDGAGERVVAAMVKRYGPNKCNYDSTVTVIYLREVSNGNDADDGCLSIREA